MKQYNISIIKGDGIGPEIVDEAIKVLDAVKIKLFRRKGKATSSKKQKSFSKGDVEKIEAELKPKNKWDQLLKAWITAGIITGLRPAEWPSATRVLSTLNHPVDEWGTLQENSQGSWLVIKNAKNTNERGNGKYRALNLEHLNEDENRAVNEMLRLISDGSHTYKKRYEGCRKRLIRINQKVFKRRKKRPSLYSCRHQFRANASSADQTLDQIAALMGHASDETATTHYGYAKLGAGRQPILPHPVNQQTVRNVYQHYQNRSGPSPRVK